MAGEETLPYLNLNEMAGLIERVKDWRVTLEDVGHISDRDIYTGYVDDICVQVKRDYGLFFGLGEYIEIDVYADGSRVKIGNSGKLSWRDGRDLFRFGYEREKRLKAERLSRKIEGKRYREEQTKIALSKVRDLLS